MNPKQLHTHAHILTLDTQHITTLIATIHYTAPDGYPTTTGQPHYGTAELTPTEQAAHQRLGDIQATTGQPYHPGPTTQLDDLAELIQGARDLIRRAIALTNTIGTTTPTNYDHLRCPTCRHQWADPRRRDGQCTDCGRTTDTEARRHRRYRMSTGHDPAAWDTQAG